MYRTHLEAFNAFHLSCVGTPFPMEFVAEGKLGGWHENEYVILVVPQGRCAPPEPEPVDYDIMTLPNRDAEYTALSLKERDFVCQEYKKNPNLPPAIQSRIEELLEKVPKREVDPNQEFIDNVLPFLSESEWQDVQIQVANKLMSKYERRAQDLGLQQFIPFLRVIGVLYSDSFLHPTDKQGQILRLYEQIPGLLTFLRYSLLPSYVPPKLQLSVEEAERACDTYLKEFHRTLNRLKRLKETNEKHWKHKTEKYLEKEKRLCTMTDFEMTWLSQMREVELKQKWLKEIRERDKIPEHSINYVGSSLHSDDLITNPKAAGQYGDDQVPEDVLLDIMDEELSEVLMAEKEKRKRERLMSFDEKVRAKMMEEEKLMRQEKAKRDFRSDNKYELVYDRMIFINFSTAQVIYSQLQTAVDPPELNYQHVEKNGGGSGGGGSGKDESQSQKDFSGKGLDKIMLSEGLHVGEKKKAISSPLQRAVMDDDFPAVTLPLPKDMENHPRAKDVARLQAALADVPEDNEDDDEGNAIGSLHEYGRPENARVVNHQWSIHPIPPEWLLIFKTVQWPALQQRDLVNFIFNHYPKDYPTPMEAGALQHKQRIAENFKKGK
eukprot:TRINITY_DN7272_c0_g1_i12.p1 TRINITY_DN7272_c0_g1~~TRINITY_DN7272_c0_g1_i12.p1  ORF type:complete len:606 (+),score=167.68 TRINITY_DN7272_c0_g1_i12:523-2340(+)